LIATQISTVQSHSDLISSIDFCVKNDKTYVIIASSDCSVTLNELNGNQVGIFGQEDKWKMEPSFSARITPNQQMRPKSQNQKERINIKARHLEIPEIKFNSNSLNEKVSISNSDEGFFREETELPLSSLHNLDLENCFLPGLDRKLKIESTFKFENDAFIKDTTLRYNPWSKTILG
jgi:hypothetical protein